MYFLLGMLNPLEDSHLLESCKKVTYRSETIKESALVPKFWLMERMLKERDAANCQLSQALCTEAHLITI